MHTHKCQLALSASPTRECILRKGQELPCKEGARGVSRAVVSVSVFVCVRGGGMQGGLE